MGDVLFTCSVPAMLCIKTLHDENPSMLKKKEKKRPRRYLDIRRICRDNHVVIFYLFPRFYHFSFTSISEEVRQHVRCFIILQTIVSKMLESKSEHNLKNKHC